MNFKVTYKPVHQIKTGDIVFLMNEIGIDTWELLTSCDKELECSKFNAPEQHIPRIIQIIYIGSSNEVPRGQRRRGRRTVYYHKAFAMNYNYVCKCRPCSARREDVEIPRFFKRLKFISDDWFFYTDSMYPVLKID